MKKYLLVLLGISVALLSSCYFRIDYANILDIKIFSTENVELTGEFLDYTLIEIMESEKNTKPNRTKLNSPAPLYLYYMVDISEYKEYIVEFKIKVTNNYEVSKIEFGYNEYTIISDELGSDNNHLIRIKVKVNEENFSFDHLSYNVKKISNDTIKAGSTFQGGRTYYEGLYFNLIEE